MLALKSPNSGSPQKYARTLLHQLFQTEELGTGILYASAKSQRSPLVDRVKVLFGKIVAVDYCTGLICRLLGD